MGVLTPPKVSSVYFSSAAVNPHLDGFTLYVMVMVPGEAHFSNADDSLFKAILKDSYHALYPYLPENQYQHYHLRQRPHNKALIPKTTYLSDRDYTVSQKKQDTKLLAITLLTIIRFSKFFSLADSAVNLQQIRI